MESEPPGPSNNIWAFHFEFVIPPQFQLGVRERQTLLDELRDRSPVFSELTNEEGDRTLALTFSEEGPHPLKLLPEVRTLAKAALYMAGLDNLTLIRLRVSNPADVDKDRVEFLIHSQDLTDALLHLEAQS